MANTVGPTYYQRGSIEVWDFIRDQGLNYHLGNAIKYVCRAGYKDSKAEDLRKAIHYLQNELDSITVSPGTSKGVPSLVSRFQQSVDYCEDYTADFDR
jgi:hypothetical protein